MHLVTLLHISSEQDRMLIDRPVAGHAATCLYLTHLIFLSDIIRAMQQDKMALISYLWLYLQV